VKLPLLVAVMLMDMGCPIVAWSGVAVRFVTAMLWIKTVTVFVSVSQAFSVSVTFKITT
jgi:hypothetical protein